MGYGRCFSVWAILAAICLLAASCHKDTGDHSTPLIHTMAIDGNICVITCLYDEQGRITSMTQCDTVEAYKYYNDSVVYMRTIGTDVSYRNIYALDASGLATGYIHIAHDGSATHYHIFYDSRHYRIALIDSTHLNTFISYTIADGNSVYDSSMSSVIGSANYTISRTYYASTENTISNENFGRTFFGNSSENFKKSETYNTPDGIYTVKYTYELDYRNGVSRRIMKVNDSIIESRAYEYYGSD